MTLTEMQCPLCGRIWTPTMFDDCLLPSCGCFGTELDRDTPCEKCGLQHGWNCPNAPGHAERVASTTDPKFIEVWMNENDEVIGTVERGRLSQLPENPSSPERR